MNKSIQHIIKEIIKLHGFSTNTMTGFSCYIPDPKPFSTKEGLLLFVCTPKGKRIITKFEHLIKKPRRKRLAKIFNVSEDELTKELIPQIINYSQKLSDFGFHEIGRGVVLNKDLKIFNKALALSNFESNKKLLKDFESFLVSNPLTFFAEYKNLFIVKNKTSSFI
ncbi:MAG: hypothetical protein A2068_02530 [Ignavibacteria bacterium GWB2_35_6b]|nr:MAG: hypothetical protein A2068_02530 [Ignavibacteria bacterium GWB2_35_6b]